jgi:CAAX prenyl protease-like protein
MSIDDQTSTDQSSSAEFEGRHPRLALFRQYRWMPLVLPMAVFLVTGLIEPTPETAVVSPVADAAPMADDTAVDGTAADDTAADERRQHVTRPNWLGYPLVYTVRLFVTLGAILFVMPYYQSVRFSITWWAWPTGLVGGAIWIALCRWGVAEMLLTKLGMGGWLDLGIRSGFDPWESLRGSQIALAAFLAVRFCGLVLVVPLIEEFFLRGFLMRFFERTDWWTVPLGTVTRLGAVVATAYGVLSHPAEPLAALVWFSLVTLLYARTRNIWDCVVAHAVTNLTLGIYVITAQDWRLW